MPGRNPKYRFSGDAAIDNVIEGECEPIFGLNKSELAFIFVDRNPVHLMQRFLVAMFGQARPDIQFLTDLPPLIRDRLPTIDVATYQATTRLHAPRTGSWDQSIDGPALTKTMSMMSEACGVPISMVRELLVLGNESIGPSVMHHPHHGKLARLSDLEDPKQMFIHAMFGKLSKRSDPAYDLNTASTGPHYSMLVDLVRKNVGSC